jgi:hypothetical protein
MVLLFAEYKITKGVCEKIFFSFRKWTLNTEWPVWDVTKRNGNSAEINPLYYQLMVHIRVGWTPFSCPSTLTLNMTATADAAQFIPRGQVAPRGAEFPEWSVQRQRWCSVGGQLHSVGFVCTHVTLRTPTRKSLEASSPGNSRAMGWAHHGRTSDCCMCRLKTPALWEPNVAEPCTDILPAHIQTNCSEVRTLTSCIQLFTFLTSQTGLHIKHEISFLNQYYHGGYIQLI